MENAKKALIIEDDRNLVDLLSIHLKDLGFHVVSAEEGADGLRRALSDTYSLVVLDLMLPGFDGLEICRRLRRKDRYTPLLILTARSEEVDKVIGLELGADDYMTKPFSIREFIARVKAVTRRFEEVKQHPGAESGQNRLQFDDLSIDLVKREVSLAGKVLKLTGTEYDLLLLFARNPGRAFSRQQLLEEVWDYGFDGYDHTVNSHINRLRKKIEEDPAHPRYIKTVWGYGYRFFESREAAP
jgi:two-component system alkaline phosphatase synthesis response regulator PhoP